MFLTIVSEVVMEAMHESSPGPLKGALLALKALHGSETETRELQGGTENKSISLIRVIDLPFRIINDFLQKGKRIEFR